MKTRTQDGTVRGVANTRMPTKWGLFRAIGFERENSNGDRRVETALALVLGDVTEEAPLLRIHSQCVTGEIFGSLRCDCGEQLEIAMQAISAAGRGLLIYEYQEGRGIGLLDKLLAYELQDAGLDTVEANHALGFRADYRDFGLPAAILQQLGVSRVRLLSNNPNKTRALLDAGIDVVEQVSCEITPTEHSLDYLRTKKEKMGHTLTLVSSSSRREEAPSKISHLKFEISKSESPQAGGHENHDPFQFASIEEAIRDFKAGRMIVVVDDEDRENEGDLTMAAEMITPEAINFMAMHGRGLICVAMAGERLDELALGSMVPDNTALGGTAFTISTDVKGPDVTTGISAHDRAQTIWALADTNSRPEDFARPGHVFPLRSREGGVLERRGQTEAAVDLASLAGFYPVGVICEILNDDGTMARVPDLIRFCKKHGLLMISVADLARYRLELDFETSFAAIDGLLPISPGSQSRCGVLEQ
ncbi:MAG: 3,4-dihydroxy-2-butanone 4-phosphate synthase [Verrucomicrobiales bacterium]|jgi:3,4-dihydroxy-2-butanone 4-phosphate synthase/GTP cyclohydrolase II|nr:3,4-dihydroxy-2-butanone 4-phosphate synthase [Verrucomicrobiales bacterium]